METRESLLAQCRDGAMQCCDEEARANRSCVVFYRGCHTAKSVIPNTDAIDVGWKPKAFVLCRPM